MTSENSALTALAELKNLEHGRQQTVAAEKAEQERAREQEERESLERMRAGAERERIEAEGKLKADEDRREKEAREERIQIAEAEARAHAEKETRLKEEQMRLDSQVKIAERKQKPRWLFAVAGTAVVSLLVGGAWFYSATKAAEQRQAALEAEKSAVEARSAELSAALATMEAEKSKMDARQVELDTQLAAATSDAERTRIESAKLRLAAEQDELEKKVVETKRTRPKTTKKTKDAPESLTKTRKDGDKINLGPSVNPLD